MKKNLGRAIVGLSIGGFVGALYLASCAALAPVVTNVEKHGVAFENCTREVIKDAVIVSANVVLIAERQGMPVEIASRILQQVAVKESAALKVCAEGGTPEKLWTPNDNTTHI